MWTPKTQPFQALPGQVTDRPAPAPATPPSPSGKDGAQLFSSELQRATGRGEGGEAHRDARRAGQDRRTAQAQRAEQADTQRSEARSQRQTADQGRTERRGERLAQNKPNTRSGSETRPAETRPRSGHPESPSDSSRPRPTSAELPATRPQHAAEPTDTQVLPGLASEAARPLAQLQDGARAKAAPAPDALQRAAVRPAVVHGPTETSLSLGNKPTTEPRAQATAAPTPEPFADVLGELLLEREALLERQASVLRQVRAQLSPGNREISLQLSPAALGQVQLRISLRNGQLTGFVRASNPEALEALENQLPELTASLEAQGFDVADFEFGLIQA